MNQCHSSQVWFSMNIYQHDGAVRPADFLLRVDLTDHGAPGHFEQLWAKQIGALQFQIASIPYLTYGISLGDIVETDDLYDYIRVLVRSGRRVLRISIANVALLEPMRRRIQKWIDGSGLLHEWLNGNYVAIDYPSENEPRPDMDMLERLFKGGDLFYEVVDEWLRPE